MKTDFSIGVAVAHHDSQYLHAKRLSVQHVVFPFRSRGCLSELGKRSELQQVLASEYAPVLRFDAGTIGSDKRRLRCEAALFAQAVANHRRLEELLQQTRELSQIALLGSWR
jgi:hypothetical protein